MKEDDPLHALVHSLTPNERRYFRLFSLPGGKTSTSNARRLFEFLLTQAAYSETALHEQFAGERLLLHLSSEKNYLYRQLLRCLRVMRDEGDRRSQIRAEIENSILLFERGLYSQCHKRLRHAKKMALGTEQHLLLLEILVWERRLWKILHQKNRAEIANNLIAAQVDILDKLRHTYAYYDLYDRMFLLTHQKFNFRTNPQHPALVAILEDPLLSSPAWLTASRRAISTGCARRGGTNSLATTLRSMNASLKTLPGGRLILRSRRKRLRGTSQPCPTSSMQPASSNVTGNSLLYLPRSSKPSRSTNTGISR